MLVDAHNSPARIAILCFFPPGFVTRIEANCTYGSTEQLAAMMGRKKGIKWNLDIAIVN